MSEELLEEEFVCNISKCKGECCVQGDSGAPLLENELSVIEDLVETVIPYLPESGVKAIKDQGAWVIDSDGDFVTPLVDGAHCAFVTFEKGVAICGIEKAYNDGKINFRKPESCHLYPIRIQKTRFYEGLNYHRWEVCSDACSLGKELKVPVYKFLKEALIRKYGAAWYEELEMMAEELKKSGPIR